MTATYSQGEDAIKGQFKTAWDSGAAAIVGTTTPDVRWENNEKAALPAVDKYWARHTVQEIAAPQTSFKSGIAPDLNKRYTRTGLIFVQLFCPLADAQALVRGQQLAELVQNAYRGKETVNGVWFRNVRINKLPPDSNWYRFNIVVEYEFDDIG